MSSEIRELVVISGKGGTGKTSLVASFAALATNAILADCDVDAADLHLLLSPTIRKREEFRAGHEAVIRQEDCIGCGACLAHCRFDAVTRIAGENDVFGLGRTACEDCAVCTRSCPVKFADMMQAIRETCGREGEHAFVIDPTACEGCGVCVDQCPVKAINFPECVGGEWFVSETRFGGMAHARLEPGGENSGKLVSKVREEARALAQERGNDLILVDGPPGVGCAVIASLTGATRVLVVTEPTLSGAHDMARVLELTRHFSIPAAVCVNKWDLNPEMAGRIEADAEAAGATLGGRVRYDPAFTAAQLRGLAVVETEDGPLGDDIRTVWERLSQ